jgi:hypothetical protein
MIKTAQFEAPVETSPGSRGGRDKLISARSFGTSRKENWSEPETGSLGFKSKRDTRPLSFDS